MNTDLILNSKISHVENNLTPKEILLHGIQNAIIPFDKQPINGTLYMVVAQTITLPLTENFKNYGFRIVIISTSDGDLKILPASPYMNDVITYNQITYSKGDNNDYQLTNGSYNYSLSLDNRGIIELIWTLGGWYVLSGYGINITQES